MFFPLIQFSSLNEENAETSIFNIFFFLIAIISICLSFVIISIVCFYKDLQTFMCIIIVNIIFSSTLLTICYFFLELDFLSNKDTDIKIQIGTIIFLFSLYSLSFSLSFLLFFSGTKIARNEFTDKGSFIGKGVFFLLSDVLSLIIAVILEITHENSNKKKITYSWINSMFLIIIFITICISSVWILVSMTKAKVEELNYPYKVLLFPIVFFICCVPFLVSNIIILFNGDCSVTLQISALFVLFLQGILYSICFLIYPPFLSIIKSCFIKRKKSKKISKIEINNSNTGTILSNSLTQSLTQTIYD